MIKPANLDILRRLKDLSASILPKGASAWLYGSRARGEDSPESDWDILILLDKTKADEGDFNDFAFPYYMLGAEVEQNFVPIIYGKVQWNSLRLSPFHRNVESDAMPLI